MNTAQKNGQPSLKFHIDNMLKTIGFIVATLGYWAILSIISHGAII